MQKFILTILLFTGSLLIASCDKDDDENPSAFLYGQWKTSYGDTISFSRSSNKDMVHYDASMNPSLPLLSHEEYRYEDGKLFLKRSISGLMNGELREMSSFKWLDYGKSFELQGMQWFMFLSSSQTYFTFTRIP